MTNRIKLVCLAGACALGLVLTAPSARAGIVAVNLGTGAPPATLGPYTMTEFPQDGRADFTNVTSVPSPLGGTVGFSNPLNVRTVPSSWATWSHGYTGKVYFETGNSVVLTLPPNTGAFDFWAEPDNFGVFNVTATAQDGTTLTEAINGLGGASGFGFFGTGGSEIVSLTVSADAGAAGFAISEFGIAAAAVPEPTSLALLAIGGLTLAGVRRWRRRTIA
jgi:PEP-CTERM motif-containing protein